MPCILSFFFSTFRLGAIVEQLFSFLLCLLSLVELLTTTSVMRFAMRSGAGEGDKCVAK